MEQGDFDDIPGAGTNNCIALNDVWKSYGKNPALKGLTMNVKCGERVALLGPNGAGKSTTLRIIAGLLRPDRGKVYVAGYKPNDIEAKRTIGFLPEDATPYLTLSVRENLEYIGSIRRTEGLGDRVEELLDMLDLRQYEKSRTSRLSRGNRQKLALALAIIHRPGIIIMDEPLNYLDIPTQETVIGYLSRMDSSFLVSTHIMSIAERMTSKVIIITLGQKVWDGSISDLRSKAGPEVPIEKIVSRMMNNVPAGT